MLSKLLTAAVLVALLAYWISGSARLETVPLRIACVGDSITEGVGSEDSKDSYPAQLGSIMGERFAVENFGVSSTTVVADEENMSYVNQSSLLAALAFKPDVVILKFGTNDAESDNELLKAQFVARYVHLIERFQQLESGPEIWICYPIPIHLHDEADSDFLTRQKLTVQETIIPMIDEVARDTGSRIIDLNQPLADKPHLFADEYHPNAEGYHLMAKTVAASLRNSRKIEE